MPCSDGGFAPGQERHIELAALVSELGIDVPRTVGSYQEANDLMARLLCNWCQSHDVTKQSLELQIFWRDHQKADAKRLAKEAEAKRTEELRSAALYKLSTEEKRALGLIR